MARIFLAIPLTEEIKDKILQVNSSNGQLERSSGEPGRTIVWMKPENLHITIYFIGQASRENTPLIIEKIKNVLKEQSSLAIQFENFCIAPKEKPRMIWTRFLRNSSFKELSNKIHDELNGLISNNPHYYDDPIPHITLARFNSTFNTELIKFPKTDLNEIEIKDCELWESVSTPKGVKYECVERFYLKS